MNQFNLNEFGTPIERVKKAIASIQTGQGVLVLDDEDRENEGDIIWAAESITCEQMALTIRYGSGIVCLCLPQKRCDELNLPMMVENNTSKNNTAFTISIEAANGVTTGVSASDRVTTIKAAVNDNAKPSDLNHPGHVFPLVAKEGGVLVRRGHTEASIDLVTLAGLKPAAVLCELTNDDGTMARVPEVVKFAKQYHMPVVTIEDIVEYRNHLPLK
ncbi:3,4-dihydroxy-2-butanone-4-phosphate synthase [Gilliamella sp. Bif1-4]|jgi:3,4-dihydroxy 2-butanone 4-phosphate synthase|uniref:3,4-dihydroxy-2-butanone-4-phosphate synthase n=1 Tax=Gilliamella sp. Bif1-4 TaxID=3120233 RepID=UPI00080E97A7|nr:3,4-dihydroxy-2-butanone-4-phosphate synthase [Gilliamella apicola]OCG42040.1 3,4-dihydroxy-2-butanone-4-phosphate synthase [Gilliamella apicola]